MLKSSKMIQPILLLDADFYTIFKGCILNNNISTLLLLSLPKRLLLLTLSSNSSLPSISSIIAYIVATTIATSTSNRTTNCNMLLQNLCFNTYYYFTNKKPKVSFNVDSTYCFLISLVVARKGIQINATTNPTLNLKANIYFAILIS